MLAHEYGWAKSQILGDVYLDELILLLKNINKRKIGDYKMQMAITQNPYTKNPKELWAIISRLEEAEPRPAEFDEAGFEQFKKVVGGNPKFIVK